MDRFSYNEFTNYQKLNLVSIYSYKIVTRKFFEHSNQLSNNTNYLIEIMVVPTLSVAECSNVDANVAGMLTGEPIALKLHKY